MHENVCSKEYKSYLHDGKDICTFLKKRYDETFSSLSSLMNCSILIFYDRNFLINIMRNYLGVYIFKLIYRITTNCNSEVKEKKSNFLHKSLANHYLYMCIYFHRFYI